MRYWVVWLLLMILLIGCQSLPTVNVYGYQVSDSQQQSLTSDLEQAGYQVQWQTELPPVLTLGNFILTAPNHDSDASPMLTVLEQHGVAVSLVSDRVIRNHSYRSGQHIGLYLVNSAPTSEAELVAQYIPVALTDVEFSGVCPDRSLAQLQLQTESTLRWQQPGQQLTGTWQQQQQLLTLTIAEFTQHFTWQQLPPMPNDSVIQWQLLPFASSDPNLPMALRCQYQARIPLVL